MIYLRYRKFDDEAPAYGWMEEGRVGTVTPSPFGEHVRGTLKDELERVQLAAPVIPSKIICTSGNYDARLTEVAEEPAEVPCFFYKPPSAIIGPGAAIKIPPQSQQVEYGAELAIVIGRTARWVSVEDAHNYVLGYTCANDVAARDAVHSDRRAVRGRSFDTFLPIGPWIATDVDPSDLVIVCTVNGQVRQMASTRDMRHSVPQLVAYLSSIMTLVPGDVILTGTPGGVGQIETGDVIEIEIEGIGELRNTVEGADTA